MKKLIGYFSILFFTFLFIDLFSMSQSSQSLVIAEPEKVVSAYWQDGSEQIPERIIELPSICTICQDTLYNKKDGLLHLQCGYNQHVFHYKCISQQWPEFKLTCPNCRANHELPETLYEYYKKSEKLDIAKQSLGYNNGLLVATRKNVESKKSQLILYFIMAAPLCIMAPIILSGSYSHDK